ncbi:MAG: pentapeptide repeat-containing protein [Elainellaceae cyanobacterium]
MKLKCFLTALLMAVVMWGAPAYAFQTADLDQLIATRACVECDLQDIDLRGSNLSGVNLEKANLSRANLMAVNLMGANLEGATLDEALMFAVNLLDANLRGVSVFGTELGGAYVCNTTIPSGRISNRDCEAEDELIDEPEDSAVRQDMSDALGEAAAGAKAVDEAANKAADAVLLDANDEADSALDKMMN